MVKYSSCGKGPVHGRCHAAQCTKYVYNSMGKLITRMLEESGCSNCIRGKMRPWSGSVNEIYREAFSRHLSSEAMNEVQAQGQRRRALVWEHLALALMGSPFSRTLWQGRYATGEASLLEASCKPATLTKHDDEDSEDDDDGSDWVGVAPSTAEGGAASQGDAESSTTGAPADDGNGGQTRASTPISCYSSMGGYYYAREKFWISVIDLYRARCSSEAAEPTAALARRSLDDDHGRSINMYDFDQVGCDHDGAPFAVRCRTRRCYGGKENQDPQGRRPSPLCQVAKTVGVPLRATVLPCTDVSSASVFQVLHDWKPAAASGVILWLLDGGSSCFVSPYQEHILCAMNCDVALKGVGTARTTQQSSLALSMMTAEGRYCTLLYPKCYNVAAGSLEFAIASGGSLERCGWKSVLGSHRPRLVSPAGHTVPLLTDFGTGFHFIPEIVRAQPSVRYREWRLEKAQAEIASGQSTSYISPPTKFTSSVDAKPDTFFTNETYDDFLQTQSRGGGRWNRAQPVMPISQQALERIDGRQASSQKVTDLRDTNAQVFAVEDEGEAKTGEGATTVVEKIKGKARESDQDYFTRVKRDAEKLGFRKPIRLRLPHVKLADTGEPADVQKLKEHVHNLFGHIELKKVFEAVDHIDGAEIIRILKVVRGHSLSDKHCGTCAEYKSRLPSLPQGKTVRPMCIRKAEKVYVDLLGYVKEASIFHHFHYLEAALTDLQYAEAVGLAFRSQALLGMAKIFSKLGGFPGTIQIDGESTLNTGPAKTWMTGKGSARSSRVVVTEAYNQWRNGKVERMWGTWKSIARCLLGKARLPLRYWYHAIQFAVAITNMITLIRDEQGAVVLIKGNDGVERSMTAFEAHFGEKPDLQRTLLGPFGSLAYLILTKEQRGARALSGGFGVRAIAGIYLGPQICPSTGVFNHVITDGRTLFASPQNVKVIPDVFPGAYSGEASAEAEEVVEEAVLAALDRRDESSGTQAEEIKRAADELRKLLGKEGDESAERVWLCALAKGEPEMVAKTGEGAGGMSAAGEYHRAWLAACTEQARDERETIAFVKSGEDGEAVFNVRKAKAKSSRTRVDRIAAGKDDKVLQEGKAFEDAVDPNVAVEFERPEDLKVPTLPDEYEEVEPYAMAKYTILVPRDFGDAAQVAQQLDHPHLRFVGRSVRKAFETPGRNGKTVMKDFSGKVESYSAPRLLFKAVYSDGDKEEYDFSQLMEILVMAEEYGDSKAEAGKTRGEVLARLKAAALLKTVREELWVVTQERAYGCHVDEWYGEIPELVNSVVAGPPQVSPGIATSTLGTLEVPVADPRAKVLYDDEPKNQRELDAHPEKKAILESGRAEMDQLISMEVGTLLSAAEVDRLIREKEVILRSRMLYKRKYTNVSGMDRFLKWKGRLAVDGSRQRAGIDTVWETFSPTVGFAAIRSMVAVLCDPKYAVDSYDLSGAFLGTTLEDQALYVRLPHDAGDYAHRVIRLTKAVYGVKNSGKLFMKQLGEAIMAFEERVDVQTAGVEGHKGRSVDVSRFERMKTDQCMYSYIDGLGRHMVFLSYVDDIILATTDTELRERFLAHLRKTWKITCEGKLDRFLAVNFSRSDDGWMWSACLSSYITKIADRYGLTETRAYKTPMEPGFALTEADFAEEPTEEMVSLMRSLVGSIGYAVTALRFDAAYALSVLSRHLARPCKKVIDAAKRVVMYLFHTKDFTIQWRSSREEQDLGTSCVLTGAVDASYATDAMTRRSHGGWINVINHGAVSWKSGLQAIVTLSSCESEYVALCAEVCEVMYLRSLLYELGHEQVESTLVWEDNRAAILIAEQETSSAGRCKHIDVKLRFVAEAVKDEIVRVRYTPTEQNIADLFTKPLSIAVFERLIKAALDKKSGAWVRGGEVAAAVTVTSAELFMLVDA